MPSPAGGSWAAAGPAGDDTAYHTQTLKFTGMELALDESVPFVVLFRLWLYAAIISWAILILFFILGVITGVNSASDDSSNPFGADSGTPSIPGGGLIKTGFVLAFIAFWVILLAAKIQEPVAEWKTLLEGKAPAAESGYAAIFNSLARRRIPVAISANRVRSDVLAADTVNNRLVITERTYIAYISVFGYGTSLYVGWMMWRSRRGVTLIGQFLKDLIGGILGRTGMINQMLRTEKVRAMREAVHSAVREGVDAAVAGIDMPIAATFGYDIPVQTMTAAVPIAGAMHPPSTASNNGFTS